MNDPTVFEDQKAKEGSVGWKAAFPAAAKGQRCIGQNSLIDDKSFIVSSFVFHNNNCLSG